MTTGVKLFVPTTMPYPSSLPLLSFFFLYCSSLRNTNTKDLVNADAFALLEKYVDGCTMPEGKQHAFASMTLRLTTSTGCAVSFVF